jgi:hypothetical protein
VLRRRSVPSVDAHPRLPEEARLRAQPCARSRTIAICLSTAACADARSIRERRYLTRTDAAPQLAAPRLRGDHGILLLALVLAAFGFGYLANFDMQQIVRWAPRSG